MLKMFAAVGAVALLAIAPAAQAGVIEVNAGLQAMRDYNLITFGDFNTGHDVEGRAFIGGNVTGGASTFYNQPGAFGSPAPLARPGLVVVGDVEGPTRSLNNGAGAAIGGSADSHFNLNGPNQTVNAGGTVPLVNVNGNTVNQNVAGLQDALALQRDTMFANLTALSDYLAGLDANVSTTTPLSNVIRFDAGDLAGTGLAVFELANTNAFNGRDIEFSTGGHDLVVINVGGLNPILPSGTNFQGTIGELGANVIWNFYEAETIGFNAQFWGSVLAVGADAQFSNSPIEGTAVFKSFVQGGEVHMANFNSDFEFQPPPVVPEPATWAMMIMGFGAAGAVLRRRQPLTA